MAGYIPALLPDETLYSLLARLAYHRGNPPAGLLVLELFGRRHAISSFDLPGHLQKLTVWFDGYRGLDADGIIDRLTLFPFYTAYLSEDRRLMARSRMKGDMTGVHTSLGVTTFRIPGIRVLRYCPRCVAEWDDAGEQWRWRRAHQLSGVLVCPEHGDLLRQSAVSMDRGLRHRFVASAPWNCLSEVQQPSAILTPDAHRKLAILARAAQQLLNSPPPALTPDALAQQYRNRLAAAGLMRSAKKVDQVAFETCFTEFWGEVLPLLPELVDNEARVGGWLASMVRSRRQAVHPLLHILLTKHLDSLAPVEPPFGYGPWPCRNPLAVHYHREVIEAAEIRRDGDMQYGDFRCSCGYVYTHSLSAQGEIGPPRYRHFGPLLKPALVAMLSENLSLRAIAARVGLDPKTLMRESAMLGLSVPWKTKPSGKIVVSKPTPARSVKRKQGSIRAQRTRNWDLIDLSFARRVDAASQHIRSVKPVLRVRLAEIERRIATRGWIGKRKAKLPRTWQAVTQKVESVDEFRIRRLDAAISSAFAEAPSSTPSEILRQAGLPAHWLPIVRLALIEKGKCNGKQLGP